MESPTFHLLIYCSGFYFTKPLWSDIFIVDIAAGNPAVVLIGGRSCHGSHVLSRASTASVSDRNSYINGWIIACYCR